MRFIHRACRLGCVTVLIGAPFAVASASGYAGAEACRKCHRALYDSQSISSHASALARSRPPQPGEWAFGSGAQAITFVDRRDADHYVELGQTWYRRDGTYSLTPGHHDTNGVPYRIFDPSAAIMRCFGCHSTGPLSFSRSESILPRELGVRCEACHGPAADHAADPTRFPMPDPKSLTASGMNELCGKCHRMPAAAGDSTDLGNPWNARHQPLLLAASRCFRESKERLSCVSCHSPHAQLETRLSRYDAACESCHRAPQHRQAVASRSCVTCHMPTVALGKNLAFTNHRIAIYSPSDLMLPVASAH